eukprot:11826803-Alexandrium_andersonii.AAC.1
MSQAKKWPHHCGRWSSRQSGAEAFLGPGAAAPQAEQEVLQTSRRLYKETCHWGLAGDSPPHLFHLSLAPSAPPL